MEEFHLTPEETKVMFSYQYHLVLADIENDTDTGKKYSKRLWLAKWKGSTETLLMSQTINLDGFDCSLITDYQTLKSHFLEITNNSENRLKLYLILLEVILFKPYYPLGITNNDQFKELKIYGEDKLGDELKFYVRDLGLSTDTVTRFKTRYNEAYKGIKNDLNPWWIGAIGAVAFALVAAIFTPAIAYLLAPIMVPGLSGAAAISAVLAALGGGAIAVGGLGMAGGCVVIIAGGAILGTGAGVAVGALFAQSPDLALREAAKLEVVIREIIDKKDFKLAQEIIKQQKQAIRSLEDERDELLLRKEDNKQKIENLEKSIGYLKNALQRNMEYLKKAME